MKNKGKVIGAWAFLIGVLLAIIVGIFETKMTSNLQTLVFGILVIAGIVVGLLNVSGKESSGFLLAAVSLVIASSLGGGVLESLKDTGIGLMAIGMLKYLLILFVPTTIIVALKSVFALARD